MNLYSWSTGIVGDWEYRYKGFSSSEEEKLSEALVYLYKEIHRDLAGREVGSNYLDRHERKNCTIRCPCLRTRNGRAWGGYNTGTPSALVDEAFRKGNLRFRFHRTTSYVESVTDCREWGTCWVCATSREATFSGGHISCYDTGDAPDKRAKIRLCEIIFDPRWSSFELIATAVVHEVLHALGADEKAAYEMDPRRDDFTGGCDDATCG
jgi:hypothetical protein